jgi:hypothetical protein
MDQLDTLIAQVCKDTGITVTMQLWLPGDPQPKGLRATLTQATIVMDAKSNLNVTGPTGTFLDGILQTAVDLENSALGQVLAPFLNPSHEYAPQGINIAPKLGVNFVQPWVVMTDDPAGGTLQYSIKARHALAHTIVAGGKSPQWASAPLGNRGGRRPRGSNLNQRPSESRRRFRHLVAVHHHRHQRHTY